ncbi:MULTISPECIES: TfpX/TfpZ family type IV pilin accessory protein [unclassified Psychrobacter]|uniref:TfpX/TfpZ family type IV pilin accessory protein n=1 Tax=unclassified Psychrobacter TaxID=196806 RepID=UPI000C7A1ABF|nr:MULTISPECIES: TfpX/TfpZ family type IV pilin accessory protein [unclassified Psychrobacter]PKG67588.1 type IV pilin accessory protein [Psychrobacter sp. Choline-02u-13]PKH48775.1 type IV pilin accessory protein [Psychrobacter sp. Choline-02u-9]
MSPRLKFFIKHLCISLIVALLVLTGIFTVWYPAPLAKATGVTHIVLLMIAIDVIVGPILSLIVYKANKKTLKFDLLVIILLQISALSYGIYSLAEGRPVWMAFNGNRFELIRNNELLDVSIDNRVDSEYYHPSLLGPRYVAVKIAVNQLEREKNMFEELQGGISLAQRPERYVAIAEANGRIIETAEGVSDLKNYNSEQAVDSILDSYPNASSYLGLKANAVDMTLLLDDEGNTIEIVDLRPW